MRRCTSPTSCGRARSPASASAASTASSSRTRRSPSARSPTWTSSSPRQQGRDHDGRRRDATSCRRTSSSTPSCSRTPPCQPLIELQERLRAANGKEKRAFTRARRRRDPGREGQGARLGQAQGTRVHIKDKKKRCAAVATLHRETLAELTAEGQPWHGKGKDVDAAFGKIQKKWARGHTLATRTRIDGRDPDEIRQITIETGVLPRAHGSALFTRGETQALVAVTLGTKYDEKKLDTLLGDMKKTFYMDYNFPPFSTGEVKPLRGQSRREVGHGFLAERSVEAIVPVYEDFPYTIRVVSDILESNGSSSMAVGVRRLARADGRRRADEGAGRRHRDGPHEGRR